MARARKPPPQQPGIRDRIRELRRVRAADLSPHPKNARRHPADQRRWVSGLLQELGYADALVGRELPDGQVQILDGHLRAEITPDQEVPVLIVDLDDREAELLLATHDETTKLAEVDFALQLSLLGGIEPADADVRQYLQALEYAGQLQAADDDETPGQAGPKGPAEMALMPHEHYDYLIVLARNTHEWNRLCELLHIGLVTNPNRRKNAIGIGRGIPAAKLLSLLERDD